MAINPHERIQRGFDSSGRPLYATRMNWQHFDRVNEQCGNKLVTVQGSWSDATASANTHRLAGCRDVRVWNLTADECNHMIRVARDPDIVGHAAAFIRTAAQGFDPHSHWILMGDLPMDALAAQQIQMWMAGLNGLASGAKDDFPWRPDTFTPYQYIEDDMFTEEDHKILTRLDAARINERTRDQAERERDKERFSQLVTAQGQMADTLGILASNTKDAATAKELRQARRKILRALKDDPDVTGVDNPSDEGMAAAEEE